MTDEKKTKQEEFDLVIPEKGLHRPVKIQVGGKTYYSNPMLIPLFEKLKAYQEEAEAGDSTAPNRMIMLVFGISKAELLKIDLRDVGVVGKLVMKMMIESELYRSESEKNVARPGKKSSS